MENIFNSTLINGLHFNKFINLLEENFKLPNFKNLDYGLVIILYIKIIKTKKYLIF